MHRIGELQRDVEYITHENGGWLRFEVDDFVRSKQRGAQVSEHVLNCEIKSNKEKRIVW